MGQCILQYHIKGHTLPVMHSAARRNLHKGRISSRKKHKCLPLQSAQNIPFISFNAGLHMSLIATGHSGNSRGNQEGLCATIEAIFLRNWKDVSHCLKLFLMLPSPGRSDTLARRLRFSKMRLSTTINFSSLLLLLKPVMWPKYSLRGVYVLDVQVKLIFFYVLNGSRAKCPLKNKEED